MNIIAISGYLTADPELRNTSDGTPVASFRIACRRKFSKDKDSSVFFNVQAWRGNADFVARYFSKGKPIEIEGYLDSHPWSDKNGSKHEGIRIVADRINFSLGDKPRGQEQVKSSAPSDSPEPSAEFDPFALQPGDPPDDLPF